jgi:O-antigen/teichoic acid export membrane protein
MGRRRPRIVSQTGLILGGQLLTGVVLFVTTPYIALGLGAERYGLYTLLFLFLGYTTALDFGLSFALVKHVAEHDPTTHRAEIDSFVNTAAAVYAVIATLFVAVLVPARGWIASHLLHVPTAEVSVARDAMLFLAGSVPFATATTIFNALFRGLLRFEYLSFFSLANAAVYSIGAALLVTSGASLRAVIGWYAALTMASALAQWAVLRRLLPGFYPVPHFEGRRIRQLFGFGGFIALNQLGNMALHQLDRLVIARALSVSMAAYYAIPFNISQRLNMLGAAAATVTFPHSSASTARGELDDFRLQHLQSARVVAWLTLAPTLTIIVLADQILRYWMNPEFALHGAFPLRILAVGVLGISVASLDAVSIEGSGRPWVTALFTGITGITSVVGLLLLTPMWGLVGAAASVTFSVMMLAALDVWYCNRTVLQSRLWSWARGVVLPSIWTTFVCLPFTFLLRRAVSGLPSTILVALVATGFTAAVGSWFFVTQDERRSIVARVRELWSHEESAGSGQSSC